MFIPYEDRKGEWMNYAIDRAHFKRRIQRIESILEPIMNKKRVSFEKIYCTTV
jgi:hypothetical protein